MSKRSIDKILDNPSKFSVEDEGEITQLFCALREARAVLNNVSGQSYDDNYHTKTEAKALLKKWGE